MRGRKPVPTTLALVRGNPGRRPINTNAPAPATEPTYTPPDWLQPLAREEWLRLEPELRRLRLLTVADLPAFAAYCSEFGSFREAESTLAKGPAGVTAKGKPKKFSLVRQLQLI